MSITLTENAAKEILAVFAAVCELPTRLKCAVLPEHTLRAAFNSVASASTETEAEPMHAPIDNA
jgi:nitrogen fixation NifU-like protein